MREAAARFHHNPFAENPVENRAAHQEVFSFVPGMKFTVIISNYNYARFIAEAVDSALAQTFPVHEIIVVDDGSTDDSPAVLREKFGGEARVKVVAQENRGQIAAWGRGIAQAEGDVICFLDADDRFRPGYIGELEKVYSADADIDVVFCRKHSFGEGKRIAEEDADIWLSPGKDYDYGYTRLITYFGKVNWIGNYSSTLSIRTRLARELDLTEAAKVAPDYKYGADVPLLYGASLLGNKKYYLHKELVDFRLHEKKWSVCYKRFMALRGIERYYRERCRLGEDDYIMLEAEMKAVPAPLPGHAEHYRRIFFKCAAEEDLPLYGLARYIKRRLTFFRKGSS
jgi:glycosyltransferase involved in cell wall biosynthesis